jgi:hypothetical protein
MHFGRGLSLAAKHAALESQHFFPTAGAPFSMRTRVRYQSPIASHHQF